MNLDEVLRLADLANLYDKRIADRTWAAVYRAAPNYSTEIPESVAHRFLSLLGQPPRLGGLLRRLHDMRALEKILPAYSHARCLLQFNEYHKYTVDEHCLRAVRKAAEFADREDTLGQAYRDVDDNRILHLALLIHDLGKGYEEDHSEVGRRLAEETVSLNCPAHVYPESQWLNFEGMKEFESTYREWLNTKLADDVDVEQIDGAATKLMTFLNRDNHREMGEK